MLYAIPPSHRISGLFANPPLGQTVTLQGWVRTRRDSKVGFSFLEVNDGSTLKGIQVVIPGDLANYASEVLHLGTGCSVRVQGTLVESQGKGQSVEIQASTVQVIGWVEDPETYPMAKKRHSLEHLREVAHLRPRSNTIGAVARLRNRMAFATHEFFQEQGFLYVHTPIITASDCEGAGEMFTVTTLNLEALVKAKAEGVDYGQDFFGKRAHLTVSGQLNGETYASALTNIYTFGPTFRAENSNTTRHLSEFWMVEPEMAFCDLQGDAAVAEAYIKRLFTTALADCAEDMAFFDEHVEKGVVARLEGIVGAEFTRLTYTEAIGLLEASKQTFEFPVRWGIDLQTEHERWLTEQHVNGPVILTDYPKEIKAFYMRQNEDGKTVAAMDVLLPGIGEMIGGSQREERRDVLEARLVELGLNLADYHWYLDLRRYGTVPHAGFGLGFERAIQFISGLGNIRDVIPFPRAPKHAEF